MKLKKIINVFIMIVTLGVLIFPGLLLAEDDFDVYTLGEIVVTAERTANVKEIAISTEVTPEDLLATNSRTVADALQYVNGVQVTTGAKMESRISIHGFSNDKILVLIDGVPYYETKYGRLDPNQISTDNVARIDVIKGAASVLYGANAEAGVINIITKKATEKPSFSGKFEIGKLGGKALSLSHGMKKGSLSYWVSFAHREWDAWELSEDFEPRMGQIKLGFGRRAPRIDALIEDGGSRSNSDYKTDNIYFKIGLEPSEDSEYYLNLHHISTQKGYPPDIDSITVSTDPPAFSKFARIDKYDDWGADISGRRKLTDRFGLTSKIFYHNHVDDYVSFSDETYGTQIASSRYKDYILGAMLIGDYSLSDSNIIKFAINYRKDVHEQNDDAYLPFEETSSNTGSIGVEDEFILLDSRLSIVTGVSYDWLEVKKATANTVDDSGNFTGQIDAEIPESMNEINPMIGINYILNDRTRLFGSIAKKTRFPTLNEFYSSKGGNVDLTAEQSINYTVGVSSVFSERFSMEISPFFHDVSDRISRDLPDPDPENLYHNTAKIRIMGIEINADWKPSDNTTVKFGFTYNDAEDASPGQVTDKVTGVPERILNMKYQYTMPNVLGTRIDLSMVNYGKSYSQLPTAQDPDDEELENDDYMLFGTKITQPFSENWETYLSLDNIFDDAYEPESGYPAKGRSYWLGFSFKY